ncbi:MAG: HD domain-containing protein, partial [Planctomycetaceae bacterium]|nr:HD domain-containing protein [Planctomycetaceae bacterium]
MLFDTVDNTSTNTDAVATNTVNRTPRGLLRIVELYCRAKKQHQKEPNSQIPRSILRDLISALHYRDKNTFLHSQRVGQLAVGLARNLCWNEETQFHLEIAALLHDIGKIGLPDHLLFKPAQFTGDETSLMALGTEVANDILQVCHAKPELRRTIVESRMPFSFLEDQNRPLGKEICLAGRLLAVADVYESLSRNQVYRDAFSHEQIIAHLNDNAGTQFDPNIVTALTRWL